MEGGWRSRWPVPVEALLYPNSSFTTIKAINLSSMRGGRLHTQATSLLEEAGCVRSEDATSRSPTSWDVHRSHPTLTAC